MKNLYLVLLVGIFLISLVSAYDEFKDNNDGTYTKTTYECNTILWVEHCSKVSTEIITKQVEKEETTITADLIDAKIIQTEFIYTKSKVPNPTGKFFNLFNSSIFNKLTHFAYKVVNGKGILDAEERWIGAEGYIACDRKCTQLYLNQDKFKDFTKCKAEC